MQEDTMMIYFEDEGFKVISFGPSADILYQSYVVISYEEDLTIYPCCNQLMAVKVSSIFIAEYCQRIEHINMLFDNM
ncbi:hypothetical protein [Carnobacterium sp. 17-4]|uniref:hypothetical protein n=1 Tax=Carnobacterium sp. (strain 17-4) TaxID=208596 RepID=UPI0002E81105|nr:hypothetical protein [Carnobacterium sp. 17-4]